jgi:DGQHR domain-containing protein
MNELTYHAIRPEQSPDHTVLSFAASASDLLRFASIDRIGRSSDGQLKGFQRPQVAPHIREIKDYLAKPDAVLLNPIVVAFTSGVTLSAVEGDIYRITIDISNGPVGFVVDGQQRLTALSQLENKDFKVLVSALVCKDEMELRRQFVLINNTRPLSKSLIYELLPTVNGLSKKFDDRSFAAALTTRLNYDSDSSLKGQINQYTNPDGVIKDTAIQRVIMNSLSYGLMREFIKAGPDGEEDCFQFISEFYKAVQHVFADDWHFQKPRTSRLVHGAGIVAMGYVMETLSTLDGARDWYQFSKGLESLVGKTAWTAGEWRLGDEVRSWRSIQNLNRDIMNLAHYLNSVVRADIRKRQPSLPAAA